VFEESFVFTVSFDISVSEATALLGHAYTSNGTQQWAGISGYASKVITIKTSFNNNTHNMNITLQ